MQAGAVRVKRRDTATLNPGGYPLYCPIEAVLE